eukprot:gene10422-12138_t
MSCVSCLSVNLCRSIISELAGAAARHGACLRAGRYLSLLYISAYWPAGNQDLVTIILRQITPRPDSRRVPQVQAGKPFTSRHCRG